MICVSFSVAYITERSDGNQMFKAKYHGNLTQILITQGITLIQRVIR